ncbi:hypothetical protein FALCPG4_015275 [Fusarium falciforme]
MPLPIRVLQKSLSRPFFFSSSSLSPPYIIKAFALRNHHVPSQLSSSKPNLLEGVQVQSVSPASFGFVSYTGFEEVIPAGAPLPHRKSIVLRTVFDHIHRDAFPVAYRHSPRDAFVEIGRVTLTNIRSGQAKEAKLHATMEIDKTLRGFFHLMDPHTRSKASIRFDARVPPPRPLVLESRCLTKT